MLSLTATTVLVIGLIVLVVLVVAAFAYQTAHRLDRLHVRTDLSLVALEAALARRAAVARAVAASIPAEQGPALRVAADRAENASLDDREVRENQLSAALGAIDVELLPRSLVAEIADADTRVTMARRFHNDAVRDTRALRGRRFVRWLHLGGTAPMPRYFDIVDRGGVLPAALLARGGDRRVSARVILLDRDGAALLVRGHDPRDSGTHFWFTPGGGVESGEELHAAAARELREETGLDLAHESFVGPLYRREAVFTFDGDVMDSVEFFFGAAVDRFEPAPSGLTELELRTIDEMRWCPADEVRALTDPVYPAALADLLPEVRTALASGAAPDGPRAHRVGAVEPREISGYRVVRRLGAGGMGEVFLVEHPRLPRQDAVKVLGPQYGSDPESAARFLREADTLAGLRHPNIVTLYDRGEHEGRLWLSMEYVAGEDAARHLRATGPLPPEAVAHVVEQVGSALDWVWSARRLTHRDVKPGNILLEPAGAGRPPRVKLVDFGIAKAGDGPGALTATGVTVGTMAYMAPEVIEGRPLDDRADQYSLACTAFELLTGTPPFPAPAMSAVMMAHLQAPVPDPRSRRAGLPAALAPVFARAMAKQPGARFADNAEFARSFRAAITGPPVPAPPHQARVPGAPARVPEVPARVAGRGKTIALAALVGVLAVLTAVVGYVALRPDGAGPAGPLTTTAAAGTTSSNPGAPTVPGTDADGFVGSPARCAGGETLELALLTTGEKSDSRIVVCSAGGSFTYRGARAKGDNSGITLPATRVGAGEYRAVNRSPSGKTDNDTVYTVSSRGGLQITRGDGRSMSSEQVRSAWAR